MHGISNEKKRRKSTTMLMMFWVKPTKIFPSNFLPFDERKREDWLLIKQIPISISIWPNSHRTIWPSHSKKIFHRTFLFWCEQCWSFEFAFSGFFSSKFRVKIIYCANDNKMKKQMANANWLYSERMPLTIGFIIGFGYQTNLARHFPMCAILNE